MNYKMIGRFLSQIIALEACFVIPAMLVSVGYGEWGAVIAFVYTIATLLTVAGILYTICRKAGKLFGVRVGGQFNDFHTV